MGPSLVFKSDLAVTIQKTLTLSICATLKEKEREKNGWKKESVFWLVK